MYTNGEHFGLCAWGHASPTTNSSCFHFDFGQKCITMCCNRYFCCCCCYCVFFLHAKICSKRWSYHSYHHHHHNYRSAAAIVATAITIVVSVSIQGMIHSDRTMAVFSVATWWHILATKPTKDRKTQPCVGLAVAIIANSERFYGLINLY